MNAERRTKAGLIARRSSEHRKMPDAKAKTVSRTDSTLHTLLGLKKLSGFGLA
jgi:hypothetical protein